MRIIDVQQILMQEPRAAFKGAQLIAIDEQMKHVVKETERKEQERERITVRKVRETLSRAKVDAAAGRKKTVKHTAERADGSGRRRIDYTIKGKGEHIMTVYFACMIVIINFIVLNIFSGTLLYLYHRKNKRAKRELQQAFEKEKKDFEKLSQELIAISETLLERMDKKEEEFKRLMARYEQPPAVDAGQPLSGPVERKSKGKFTTATFSIEEKKAEPVEYLAEDSKYKEIYYLADKGTSLVEISRKAGKTKGEIELILSLRRTKAAATASKA